MRMVLDASAILAIIFEEPGQDVVLAHAKGSLISTVNLVEIFAKSAARDIDSEGVLAQLRRLEIDIAPFQIDEARISADLRPRTIKHGVSLADRACLALAIDRELPVLTADRVWADLDLDLGIDIRLIR